MLSRRRNGARKWAFLFLRTLFCWGNTGTKPGELSLTTAPRHLPSANKRLAQGKAAAPIPTGTSRPAAVNAKDAADAEQRLFPLFGISITALTPAPQPISKEVTILV